MGTNLGRKRRRDAGDLGLPLDGPRNLNQQAHGELRTVKRHYAGRRTPVNRSTQPPGGHCRRRRPRTHGTPSLTPQALTMATNNSSRRSTRSTRGPHQPSIKSQIRPSHTQSGNSDTPRRLGRKMAGEV